MWTLLYFIFLGTENQNNRNHEILGKETMQGTQLIRLMGLADS
jgi:hypothetical protein